MRISEPRKHYSSRGLSLLAQGYDDPNSIELSPSELADAIPEWIWRSYDNRPAWAAEATIVEWCDRCHAVSR